jgi:3-hydroxyacyl-CoA dehydrogenase/3a,7a,12a-trihydroxy-5b-cholest-24-enoyl-CoA hydratase
MKMTEKDWDLIFKVHVKGAYSVTRAAWNHMRDAGYGRISKTNFKKKKLFIFSL